MIGRLRRRRHPQRARAARRPARRPGHAVDRDRGRADLRQRAGRAGPVARRASASAWRRSRRATARRPASRTTSRVLKAKQDAGAEFAITEMFFRASDYFGLRRAGPGRRRRHPDPARGSCRSRTSARSDGWPSCPGARCRPRWSAAVSRARGRPGRGPRRGHRGRLRAVRDAARRRRAGAALLHAQPVQGDPRDLRQPARCRSASSLSAPSLRRGRSASADRGRRGRARRTAPSHLRRCARRRRTRPAAASRCPAGRVDRGAALPQHAARRPG